MTHTVVFLQVSERTFEEIRQKLRDAAYTHTLFNDSQRGSSIDMSGIALCRPDPPPGHPGSAWKPKKKKGIKS